MSGAFEDRKKFKTIHGKRMAYIEEGSGNPIVFLHGNPTSSYLWRNVMPHLEGRGRLIAPDLIGMGDSEKLDDSGPDRYTYVEHRQYLFALLEELGVSANVTLVIHDWGSALGFDWAFQHQDAVNGIAYMEAIVGTPRWDAFPDPMKGLFQSEFGMTFPVKQWLEEDSDEGPLPVAALTDGRGDGAREELLRREDAPRRHPPKAQ